jgi:hypothetical protein
LVEVSSNRQELDVRQDRSIYEFERLLLIDAVLPPRDVDDLVRTRRFVKTSCSVRRLLQSESTSLACSSGIGTFR